MTTEDLPPAGPARPEQAAAAFPAVSEFEVLAPFLPRLVHEWLAHEPECRWREVDATAVFVDISGFTRLSERLARQGRAGAEELTDVIGACFSELLAIAYAEGGMLLKFGGDALFILFTGDDHAGRGCRAATGMRTRLRAVGRVEAQGRVVRLRMSVGVHSGRFLLFLVGGSHRELVITGPAATETVTMEGTADADEIVVSRATAALIDPVALGEPKGTGVLLRHAPGRPRDEVAPPVAGTGAPLGLGLPRRLRSFLLAGGDDPEHRVATVAFVHFDGADALAASGGPGALADALDELMDHAGAVAEEHDVTFLGTDIDRDGGKIILAAGVPRAAGQDEERMLRVLRRLVEREWTLPLRIGVNRGPVFAGEIGPHYRRTYTVMGDAVNLAARLMAAATPAQILTTDGVLGLARSPFATEPLPPFMVKGKARPVQAYAVGGLQPVAAGDDNSRTLVGREEELDVLRTAVAAARLGSGSVIEIRGDAGVGKSRLLDELRRDAPDMEFVRAACLPYESANPYWAFREVLLQIMRIPGQSPSAIVETALRERVATDAPQLADRLPLLATALQLDVPDTSAIAALEPRFRKQQVEETSTAFVGAMLRTPTVVVVDDAHWMDEASTDILRQVERGVAAGPWLVCVTRNDDDTGFHASAPDSRMLRLGPLPEAAAAELVRQATEASPLHPHEIALLINRAGGNPRFLRELAREADAAGAVSGLPDSIDSLVSAQIDRLPASTRRHLRLAAVLGHAFDEPLLAAVVDDASATTGLDGLLVSDGPGRLRFRYALLREVAYEGLAYGTRRKLHERVAEVLEASSERPEDQAALLSLHFFHGDRHAESWRYARVAAERARADFANVEAAELLERALASARRVDTLDAAQVALVAEALGDVRDQIGVYDRAREAYRAARRMRADDPVYDAQLCLKEAWIAERLGRYSQAIRWLRRGLRRLDELTDPGPGAATRAQLFAWYGAVRQAQGRHHEAIDWCEQAITLARGAGDLDALAHADFLLDWAHISMGRLDRATNSVEALALYEQLGNLGGQAAVANNLGQLAYYGGRWDEALGLLERARELRLRTGDVVEAALASANCAEILLERGHYDDAEALLRDARRVYQAVGYRGGLALTTAFLGRVAARTGRTAEARGWLDEARADFVAIEGGFEVRQVDTFIAESMVLAGDAARALDLVERTIAGARSGDEIGILGPPLYRCLGYARAQTGDYDGARTALDESLALAREQAQNYEVGLTLVALSRLGGDESECARLGAEATAILAGLGVEAVPEVTLSPPLVLDAEPDVDPTTLDPARN
jgi:class 3 adenylate cyclase/tetratricopeptide (TPR) repeat protein